MSGNRFDRNERLFGSAGQRLIRDQRILVIGAGGLGGHVLQQTAYLGVGAITVVDGEALDTTNKNRYVTARATDPDSDLRKVDAARRFIGDIDPSIVVTTIGTDFPDDKSLRAVGNVDCIFGCVDDDNVRFIINEAAACYDKPYIDLATEILIDAPLHYGGRVSMSGINLGCLACRNLLDTEEVASGFRSDAERLDREAIYGVSRSRAPTGPSVISVNAVVASLAVTEFMVATTGLREPAAQLTYHGHRGIVTINTDDVDPDCYYCHGLRTGKVIANLERYIELRRKPAA